MLATVRDYYKILGVGQDADKKAIKAAYRRLARRFHPDVAPGRDTAKRFIEIQEAYEALSNPTRRRLYDRATRGRRQRAAASPKRRPRIPNTEYVLSVIIGGLGLRLSAGVGGIGFVTGRRGSRRDPKDDQ
ncbi:MAG: hypothetical protein DMD80_23055 [Candidatus Rokuibacteriota bacterium]|nr:MAG: hypothetical protein DMD80_23055 [Candidatus Rokubacteria bacterium]